MIGLVQFIKEGLEGQPFGSITVKSEKDKPLILKRAIQENPHLDPKGFEWYYMTLKHNGKPNKNAKKKEIKREEGMSDWEYIQKVAKENPNFGKQLTSNKESDWKGLVIANPHGKHDEQDYEESYLINKEGYVIVANPQDGYRCQVKKPYPKKEKSGKYVHFAIDLYLDGEHVNQEVISLLKKSWGEEVAKDFAEYEKQEMVKVNKRRGK